MSALALGTVCGVLGLLVGAAIVWIVLSVRLARLSSDLQISAHELERERQARLDDRNQAERLSAEKERTLKESIRGMLAEVTNVTNAALKEREAEFAQRNGKEMRSLLEPMRQQLTDFQKAAEASKKENGALGVRIEDFFKVLQTTAGEFGRQAKSFTDALSGANKKQGNWGELILQQTLEDCGLVEGEHFVAQKGSGDGIPDIQVFDPGSRKILIVDSKMSWTKYEEAYRCEDAAARAAAMKEHVQSLKRHVDELVKANYPETQAPLRAGYTFVPLTAMFVPCDAALAAALHEAPELVDYAFKRNVALVSPLSLFGFMQLIGRAWSRYNADRNSERIFEQAKLLVDRVDKLFKGLEDVGDALEKAAKRHAEVMKLARTDAAGHSLKGPALKIVKWGGRPDRDLKSLALTEEADET